MKRRIAIICHEKQRNDPMNYVINHYALTWREDGHDTIFLFGPSVYVPADIAIMHVDLTVVPDAYLALGARYPICLNGSVRDIRKSTYSELRIPRGVVYDGRVIVKSELNYSGAPERALGVREKAPEALSSSRDYRIYNGTHAVPESVWEDPDVIVERFVPEVEDGHYVMRAMLFFGDRATCTKLVSPHAIVRGTSQIRTETVAPHPEMVRIRLEMGFDFGKLDYVLDNGRPILLDANKTVGASTIPTDPERVKSRQWRARALYSYFDHL